MVLVRLKILILKVHPATYGNFGDGRKATKRSPPRNLTRYPIKNFYYKKY